MILSSIGFSLLGGILFFRFYYDILEKQRKNDLKLFNLLDNHYTNMKNLLLAFERLKKVKQAT